MPFRHVPYWGFGLQSGLQKRGIVKRRRRLGAGAKGHQWLLPGPAQD
jgi:hypothetical protein